MIDWQNEQVIPLRDVPKYVKSRMSGKKIAVSTAWRWALKHGLEWYKTPGGRFTSIEAIGRFLDRCSRKSNGTGAGGADTNEIAKAHEKAVEAGKSLDKLLRPRRCKRP